MGSGNGKYNGKEGQIMTVLDRERIGDGQSKAGPGLKSRQGHTTVSQYNNVPLFIP